jgi:TRAP-type C4-dicarboxylate transport system permease small subunit
MMLLTCVDILLRYFRHPIPGTYEVVGFLGALVVCFYLAHTSHGRGHIAVDFLFVKLSEKKQLLMEGFNSFVCIGLFGCITWQMFLYGFNSQRSGEVSMTLQLPMYPFIYGVAAGCLLLTFVLILRFLFLVISRETKVL